MSKVRAAYCDACMMWQENAKCKLGHSPRFYLPRSFDDVHMSNYGWKRRCADFDPVTWTREELNEARAEAEQLAREIKVA